ncbi:MAG TPA: class I SAM-dependent methyltransferase [Rectinemataceae bacterium]|nr:class I SAM-dependent methyltransferase [Rectinemataceae bacterium]
MENSKGYFDHVAGQWDTMRESFFSESVRDKAMSVAAVLPGKLAADIGAGTGFISEGLVLRGLKVIAVDQSEGILAEMKKKFADSDAIDYRLGEAENLPIDDESVDYVFANMLLHHAENPGAAIAEMARILRRGGRLVITDLDEHKFEFLRTEQHDRWMGFVRDDLRLWLAAAGLENIAVDCAGENCCAHSDCGSDYADISIFIASGSKPEADPPY